jgi:hypothetical protein
MQIKCKSNARAKMGKVWVERFERLLPGGFFGIVHCVQDDGRNLQ